MENISRRKGQKENALPKCEARSAWLRWVARETSGRPRLVDMYSNDTENASIICGEEGPNLVALGSAAALPQELRLRI